MRTISADVQTELNKSSIKTAHLVEFDLLDKGTNHTDPTTWTTEKVYLTDWNCNLNYEGNIYVACGYLLSIDGMKDTQTLQVHDLSFSLSGIDQQFLSAVLNYTYHDRRIKVHRAFFNDSYEVVADPIKIFDGRISKPNISDDTSGAVTVSVKASSLLADFERKPSRHTNNSEHTAIFPNDNFFSKWGKIDKDVIWGEA